MLRSITLGCAIAVCLLSSTAIAQNDCMASLNINPSKSVTFLDFGTNTGGSISQTMSCIKAESLRENMFLSGEAIDPDLIGDADALRDKISRIRSQLVGQQAKLQNGLSRAEREVALNTVAVTLGAAGLAVATAGCATGAACLPAIVGVFGMYKLLDSIPSTSGDLVQQAVEARSQIDKILPVLQNLEGQLNDNLARQSKLRYNMVFNALCQSIKQQCL